ncbi:putative bifunctional diguanylate cyclase/phosphodiesterase [Gemmatimonas groenlandica]|uniref:EAL domain-containing protein n=1 Tax=Gemmatimonas groenlandica TaxID=2732249 RepID=A0A6M4IT42_9BACT|nr:EAL domain-containing response regulator [Gemmatimonas groenlandica]QJR37934.1 EAL domain-containing protein [Gemmatimonas groenlandica]
MTSLETDRALAPEREFIADARILVIDDDPDIHALMVAMLRPLQADIVGAATGADGLAAARTALPDVILLDHELPDATGLDILHQLRGEPALAGIPVIVVTGSESRQVLTACFAAGAADYIRKPFFGAELRARVCSVIERQRMLAQLGRAAHLDKLTGLPNRALLNARLQSALERTALEPSYSFAVMFIDFDRFKLINDSLGHDVGDLLLTEIAERLRSNLRVNDCITRDTIGSTVARLGGDEFVIVLDDVASAEVAAAVAARMLAVLEQPYLLKSHVVRSSASVGIVHSSEGYTQADDMLRDADIAMYEAKRRGKACYALFTTTMRDAVLHRIDIENSLRDAIDRHELFVVYQPIISLEDRSIESVEALVRWRHPVHGMIAPSEFIPVAEETRLILPLSDQVLRESCRQFMVWQREAPDFAPSYISVNLSRIQLADPDLVPRTMEILRETGIAPHQVQLEVTESQLMQHRVMAGELLAAFKAEGIRLAMDDFGSGYSSLSCLQEYPFDVLKVDRALTENVSRGRGYSALLHAVISLAENLGLHVVAEGIETIEQLALLQALGCPAGQGFLLARPMEPSKLEAWWSTFVGEAFEAA